MAIVEKDGKRLSVCSICGGPWTTAWACGRKVFACSRCDYGYCVYCSTADGPPRFVEIWERAGRS